MKCLHSVRFVRLPLIGLVASREALSWNVEDSCLHVVLFGACLGLWWMQFCFHVLLMGAMGLQTYDSSLPYKPGYCAGYMYGGILFIITLLYRRKEQEQHPEAQARSHLAPVAARLPNSLKLTLQSTTSPSHIPAFPEL